MSIAIGLVLTTLFYVGLRWAEDGRRARLTEESLVVLKLLFSQSKKTRKFAKKKNLYDTSLEGFWL